MKKLMISVKEEDGSGGFVDIGCWEDRDGEETEAEVKMVRAIAAGVKVVLEEVARISAAKFVSCEFDNPTDELVAKVKARFCVDGGVE